MKKILYLPIMLVLCLGFVACGDDDKPEPPVDPYDVVPFVWRGDWNNPDDPNYKKDGYNPLVGDWQSMANPKIRFTYTQDRHFVRFIMPAGTWEAETPCPFEINDMSYHFMTSPYRSYTYQYKFVTEDGLRYLMQRSMFNTKPDGNWLKYKPYKE